MAQVPEVRQIAPMSPCMSVCALDFEGYCSGCLRTRDEIAGWMRMTAAEQWAVLARLDQRRATREAAAAARRLAR